MQENKQRRAANGRRHKVNDNGKKIAFFQRNAYMCCKHECAATRRQPTNARNINGKKNEKRDFARVCVDELCDQGYVASTVNRQDIGKR